MNYRRLRGTDIEVSQLGVGCARLGGVFYKASEAATIALLRSAFDSGITFFDTADMYSQGESERILGKAFAGSRSKVVLASKVGYRLPKQRLLMDRLKPLARPLVRKLGLTRSSGSQALRGSLSHDFSPEWIQTSLEGSLRRLGTDYLDVYFLHGVPDEGLNDAVSTLEDARNKGLVRSYGVSPDTIDEAQQSLPALGAAVLQMNVSMLHQEAIPLLASDVLETIGIVARQCYASGLLARPSAETDFRDLPLERQAQVESLELLAQQMGRQLPELALRYVTALPNVDVTLVGMRTEKHLRDALRFYETPSLTAAELDRIRDHNSIPA